MPILYLTVSQLDIVQDERGGQHRQDLRGLTDGLLHCLGGVQGGLGVRVTWSCFKYCTLPANVYMRCVNWSNLPSWLLTRRILEILDLLNIKIQGFFRTLELFLLVFPTNFYKRLNRSIFGKKITKFRAVEKYGGFGGFRIWPLKVTR